MKKIIFFALFAISMAASAQVNAVGIPFGIGKTKAVELLNYKYGQYDYYTMDMVMYKDFRLDGVSYETAAFHFSDMKFTKATFHMKQHEFGKTEQANEDIKLIVEQLKKQPYIVVCLDEYGVGQTHFSGNVGIRTLYRAIPKNAALVEHSYIINVVAFVNADGIEIMTIYEPKDL